MELAKLALWLETVSLNQPLTFLDHLLRSGNSLVGASLSDLDNLPNTPPLLAHTLSDAFDRSREQLLGPLRQLVAFTSDSPTSVREKERLLRQFESRAEGFKALADLWCHDFFRDESSPPFSNHDYSEFLQALGHPRRVQELLNRWGQLLARAQETSSPFHWDFEHPEVFFDSDGRRSDAGFDAIIGNPPYDVLASQELGFDISPLKAFLRSRPEYSASFRGKNNLYKLFICRAVALLKSGGRLGFIVPMPLLGDDQAADIRRLILDSGRFTEIHAFPQKDDAKSRVFPDAKLSTAVFGMLKTTNKSCRAKGFDSTRHPADSFVGDSPTLTLTADEIPRYDPANMTVVSCAQEDWDLAVRMMQEGRFRRLGKLCESFQGEVNETTDRRKGFVDTMPAAGPEILRGAAVCLYAVRAASQGESRYIRRDDFLKAKRDSKAWHSQEPRIGFQRSAPQNNFRRLIAAPIPPNNFCFDTVSYIPESCSQLPGGVLLALLNSKLLDWYFRLGSSNSKVGEYQFNNLPCPSFEHADAANRRPAVEAALAAAAVADWSACRQEIEPEEFRPPFPLALRRLLGTLANFVCAVEQDRGPVAKLKRSKLHSDAQPAQDLIDMVMFKTAGFSREEVLGIEARMHTLL